ncbi:MAG TPA: hypothetical protein VM261_16575 [Kofleriaceae bacterium]|nr:hypothetical protein [Kofleriaceae bacterium]
MGAYDDLICFSHERWSHEPRRIHLLMARAASNRRVFYVEEPRLTGKKPQLEIEAREHGVIVVRPTLPPGMDNLLMPRVLGTMLHAFLRKESARYVLYFATPMAMAFARDLHPTAVVYDLGSDLPATDEGVAGLASFHAQLLVAADVVVDDAASSSWDETWAAIDEEIAAAVVTRTDVAA